MPASVPPLLGLTRYTSWDQVPDGLHTKTQLGEMDHPPLKPGGDPVAQVLYHGNFYAPLYQLETAVTKRRATPAQRAALDRARELQHLCRRCGVRDDEPLGKGRWCMRCSYAVTMWEKHAQAQTLARELVADPAAVLLVVDVDPEGLPAPRPWPWSRSTTTDSSTPPKPARMEHCSEPPSSTSSTCCSPTAASSASATTCVRPPASPSP
ncbi:hypothetical protein [Streptomyces zaomyceticus]|uniref:hypothetical protein n=1 Tax=Streptomyces zaomyceticus TaxID=68286 RepID=UPI0037A8432E